MSLRSCLSSSVSLPNYPLTPPPDSARCRFFLHWTILANLFDMSAWLDDTIQSLLHSFVVVEAEGQKLMLCWRGTWGKATCVSSPTDEAAPRRMLRRCFVWLLCCFRLSHSLCLSVCCMSVYVCTVWWSRRSGTLLHLSQWPLSLCVCCVSYLLCLS